MNNDPYFILSREYDQDLSCAQCITAGYVFYYGDGARKDITAPSTSAGYCCRQKADKSLYCGNDEKLWAHYRAAHKTENKKDSDIDKAQEDYDKVKAKSGTFIKQANDFYVSLYAAMKSYSDTTKNSKELVQAFDIALVNLNKVPSPVVAKADAFNKNYIFGNSAAASGVVVGGKALTPATAVSGTITRSDQFTSLINALGACPNDKTLCGTGARALTTTAIKIQPGIYDPKQSCHYLLTATCGYPVLEIKNTNESVGNYFHLAYMEYQDGVSALATGKTHLPDATDVPLNFTSYEEIGMGQLKVTKGTGVTATFTLEPASKLYKDVIAYNERVAAYNAAKKTYDAAKSAWDTKVTAVEADLVKWKDGTMIYGLKRGKRGNRETAITELPAKPVMPVVPANYAGLKYDGTAVAFYTGSGAATAGVLNGLVSSYGNTKSFGYPAQYKLQGTEYKILSAIPDVDTTCKKKYVAINVWPNKIMKNQGKTNNKQIVPSNWSLEAKTVTQDIQLVKASADPVKPVAAKASPFIKADAAMNLIASTTVAAVVAFSLY